MRYQYSTSTEGFYKGWKYSVWTDSNNNYTVTITPPYQMKYPSNNATKSEIENHERFKKAFERHSHKFIYKDRFWKFFVSPIPNISKGVDAGKEYIDNNLGSFDFKKVFGFEKPFNLL